MVTPPVGGEPSRSKWHHDPEMERMLLLKIGEVKPLSSGLIGLSRQNRNVPFSRGLCMHVNLRMPVKRRRAKLASNPIEQLPAGTHRGRWAGRGQRGNDRFQSVEACVEVA